METLKSLIEDLRELERDAEADMVHLRGDDWSAWAAGLQARAMIDLQQSPAQTEDR